MIRVDSLGRYESRVSPDLERREVGRERTHPRLRIDQDCSWNVVLVVCLVEEHVLPVSSLGSKVLQYSILRDSMLKNGGEGRRGKNR